MVQLSYQYNYNLLDNQSMNIIIWTPKLKIMYQVKLQMYHHIYFQLHLKKTITKYMLNNNFYSPFYKTPVIFTFKHVLKNKIIFFKY